MPLLDCDCVQPGNMPLAEILANIYCADLAIYEGGGGGGGLPDQAGHAGEFLTTNGTEASWAAIPGGGDVLASGTLTLNSIIIGQGGTTVAATTTAAGALTFLGTPSSANLRALVTDESGTGALLFANGAGGTFTVTTLNGLAIVAGNVGKTFTVSNTLTLEGTDGSTLDIGTGGTLGTMAYQNANGVAITGGTIDGTPVGGTTPAAGAFTTLGATGLTTLAAGTVANPSLVFTGGTTTGLSLGAGNSIALSSGGSTAAMFSGSALRMGTLAVQFGTAFTGGSSDVGIQRNAAGVLEINSTSAGTYRDLVLRNLLAGATTGTLFNTTATTVNAFGATTALNIGAGAATILNFGGFTSAAEFRFLEPSGSGTNYSGFKQPALGTSITYLLPSDAPTDGQVLSCLANGTLSWETASGSGDVTAASNFGTNESLIVADGTTKGVKSVPAVTVNSSGDLTTSGTLTTGAATATSLDVSGTVELSGGSGTLQLETGLAADGDYSGITIPGVSGYAQAFGDCVYLDPTDSRWEACDANSASGADGDSRGMVGMVVVAGTDGNACTILLQGTIRADAAFPTFTVNGPVYISETAGDVTQTQPSTSGVVIRFIGAGLTANEMYFDPDRFWYTHA